MNRLPFTAAAYTRLLVSQRGVTESPRGSNRVKFAADQGINGQSWCAAFTGWGFDQLTSRGAWRYWWAGLGCTLPYYTPALLSAARKAGLVVTTIRAGDLLLWDFPDAVHRVQHIDVALGPAKAGQVLTIDGNTSPDSGGSQSNGGGVFERRRNLSSLVAAVRLPYAPEDDMPTAKELAAALPTADEIGRAVAGQVVARGVEGTVTLGTALARAQSEAMRISDQLANSAELQYAIFTGDKTAAKQAIERVRARDIHHPGEQS